MVGAAIGWAFHASPGSSATMVSAPAPVPQRGPESAAATEAALLSHYGAPFQQAVKTAAGRRPCADRRVRRQLRRRRLVGRSLNQLPRKTGYDVVKFSQPATGFTRYKSLNLETHAAEQLGNATARHRRHLLRRQ